MTSDALPAPRDLERSVIAALKTVHDPEIPVDVWELGLIYRLEVSQEGRVEVKMTLTAPGCPVAGSLPGEVEARILAVPGVTGARVELVWEPMWNQDMMSEEAKLKLGFF
jgi:FeS assembly SUF system protein